MMEFVIRDFNLILNVKTGHEKHQYSLHNYPTLTLHVSNWKLNMHKIGLNVFLDLVQELYRGERTKCRIKAVKQWDKNIEITKENIRNL